MSPSNVKLWLSLLGLARLRVLGSTYQQQPVSVAALTLTRHLKSDPWNECRSQAFVIRPHNTYCTAAQSKPTTFRLGHGPLFTDKINLFVVWEGGLDGPLRAGQPDSFTATLLAEIPSRSPKRYYLPLRMFTFACLCPLQH